jgi:ribosomal-protein-alanine N-acetyltransferase
VNEETLRPLGGFDQALLAALHGACFPDDPWSETAMAEILAMPGVFGWLTAEVALGFVLARVAGDECEILALGVHPEARQIGLGATLLRRALATAAARGAGRCLLEAAADNRAALALYRSLGFTRVGRRRAYYRRDGGDNVDALIFARDFDGDTGN